MRNELKRTQKILSPDYPEGLEYQREDEGLLEGEDDEQRKSSQEAFLQIALHFLKRMKQEELADRLQNSKRISGTFHLMRWTKYICLKSNSLGK